MGALWRAAEKVLSRAQDGSLGGRERCRRADRSVVGRLLMVREEGLVVLVVVGSEPRRPAGVATG